MKCLDESRDEIRLVLASVAMHALISYGVGHPENVKQAFFLADEMLLRAEGLSQEEAANNIVPPAPPLVTHRPIGDNDDIPF